MRELGLLHDPTFSPRTYHRFDRFLLSLIKDERDLPFVHTILKITVSIIPLSVLLYLPFVTGWFWWGVVLAHFYFTTFRFKGPFGLMLHCTSHRPLFKPEYKLLNQYIPWVIGPFFGQTPETYYSHHIGMHHAENNSMEDDSSTMMYQRDSLRGFLRYVLEFITCGLNDLMAYLKRKKRHKLATRAFWGEMSYFALCIGLCFVNPAATVIVFILPFVISRIVSMLGNWTQHSFVDPEDPENPYKNSITCVNVKYNHKCWNDGYHTGHHIRPALHWTEHPVFFRKSLPKYAEQKALIFDGLDYLQIFFYLMNKRYDKLAQHIVNVDNTFNDEAEVITLLKHRTRRIPVTVMEPAPRLRPV
ncbi:fatty acid desaturase family protein [Larkinella sp. VNQ87]|uniref:fatty acid desaturase family protein n=1 Tax=Larkinella sp. VNQ87 TaxID=3400921 RepID=UPI003BFB0514